MPPMPIAPPVPPETPPTGNGVALRRRTDAARLVPVLLLGVALLTVLLVAGLIPAGRWQGDEYLQRWVVREWGWGFLRQRLLGTSPRPVPELLGFGYIGLTYRLRSPLIEAVLGFSWAAAALCVGFAVWRWRLWRGGVLVLSAFALTMQLRRPSEMFFWPLGAFPYLIGGGALAAASLLRRMALPAPRGARAGVAAELSLLLLAECCNEVAAAVVLFYAALVLLLVRPAGPWRRGQLLFNAAVALLVLVGVLRGRIVPQDLALHHGGGLFWSGLAAAGDAAGIFRRLLLLAPLPNVLPAPAAPLADSRTFEIAMLLGFGLACVRDPGEGAPERRLALCWAASLLGGCALSVLMSIEQFGGYCCERHASFQTLLVLLAVMVLAGCWPMRAPRRRLLPLALLLGAGLWAMMPALRADYASMPRVLANRAANWRALTAPGERAVFRQSPPGRLGDVDPLPPGTFTLMPGPNADLPWPAVSALHGFQKRVLTVVPDP
ncbi:hypothetical protein [Rhizosaccharibacter radicis]|uniref:Glycosyltransferase RgtA/B/C/D-like domain-containing protein n=1 Tax=Rhizosaccharibacter radicis TaxID=2782605 RepID=A0ABT1W060_9PROT|nr:hypothetical protein [Acetobacteraceae bacterium KSS12]